VFVAGKLPSETRLRGQRVLQLQRRGMVTMGDDQYTQRDAKKSD
jgi:hypothetical protein